MVSAVFHPGLSIQLSCFSSHVDFELLPRQCSLPPLLGQDTRMLFQYCMCLSVPFGVKGTRSNMVDLEQAVYAAQV